MKQVVLLSIVLASRIALADNATIHTAEPKDAGMSESVLRAGVGLYQEAVARDDLKGAVLLVARNGKVVLHEAVGMRHQEERRPMEKDTLFRMASNTKPVIATAILMLVEEEKLGLDDFVRKHIASWDNYRSGTVRIRHLLTHTSGLRIPTLFLDPLLGRSEVCPDGPCLVAEAARFGEVGPEEVPGTSYSYSNPGFNTLGALIEIASGEPLETFLRERIYEPLGMKDSYNYEGSAPAARMGRVYRKEEGKWNIGWTPGDGPDWPFPRASGGMISTAWDYAKFCQMYLNGGVYGEARLLSEESVRRATSPQSVSDYTGELLEASYGFGWSVGADGVFSHGGSDGTEAWVDPSRGLVVLVFTQSPGGNLLHEQFRKLVEASIY